jgi:hypothetical protein
MCACVHTYACAPNRHTLKRINDNMCICSFTKFLIKRKTTMANVDGGDDKNNGEEKLFSRMMHATVST